MRTTEKPRMTPKQIAEEWEPVGQRRQMLLDLAAAGYVIVHPDDVPARSVEWSGIEADPFASDVNRAHGWNDCRAAVFGG